MALVGALHVGELNAGADMSISHYPDQQLIKANISKVDLIQIVRVAGHVANIKVVKNMSGGISAGGGLTAFGKSARFDLRISADGLDFQGFIDNFSLGPLVVASASGDPRASMVVRMTKDEQVIKIDGMVTCFGIGFAALVDIQMGTDNPSFKAYLAVQFTEAFKIDIIATVEDFRDVKDLAVKGLYFEGRIKGDIFDVICEGIMKMLKSIEELGSRGIESLENLIEARIKEKQSEMEQLAEEVRKAHEKVKLRRKNRQEAMKIEEAKRKEAENYLEQLWQNMAKKKADRDSVEELLEEVEKARQKKAALIQRKRKEYDEKMEDAKKQEAEYRKTLEDLEKRQRTKYGTDFLKKVDLAKGAWYEKQAAEYASWRGVERVYEQKCNASIWTVAYWASRLEAAKAAHEIVKATTAAYLEAANGLEATANSEAFQPLVKRIEEAQKGIERAGKGIDELLAGGGFDGFVRAFVDTEDKRIQAAIDNLHAMQNENNQLQKAVRKAQEILDRDAPELEKEVAEADEAIVRLEEDSELAQLERDYEYQLKIHDEVHNVIEGMQAGLETLKENWKAGIYELEKVVKRDPKGYCIRHSH
ncbi:hypothetical protein EYZ11_012892 [Aspergillus tanneri]|uniref:Uncharacterized protein n=1 Tax=Aspergillus tanneri TaxID=1220188 RepID=A0A4S3IZ23_9EURO|nr:hypothetical protein EYZ11_012892 [Aspergillus tanneri]